MIASRVGAALAALGLVAVGCSDGRAETAPTTAPTPTTTTIAVAGPESAIDALLSAAAFTRRYSLGADRLGVWICRIPVGTTDPIYNPVDFRLDLDAARAADLLNQYVTPYFSAISGTSYQPEFVAEGDVSITTNENNRTCVDKAQRTAADDLTGIIVIADAEHAENQHGGWGRPGMPCLGTSPCRARDTGRAAYIGASDFHPDWGKMPAVDLLEHEIGHTLGFPHSGGGDGYTSNIDLMSNSAAPRDVDPDLRNAPDTLAVNKVAAGWIPRSDIVVAPGSGTAVLAPSNSAAGKRLLVLALDNLRFLTVEVLGNTGFDAYLPQPGVVVHEIDQRPTACRSGAANMLCQNEYRSHLPVSGSRPFTNLLGDGSSWSGYGWTIDIRRSAGGEWTIDYRRTT